MSVLILIFFCALFIADCYVINLQIEENASRNKGLLCIDSKEILHTVKLRYSKQSTYLNSEREFLSCHFNKKKDIRK